MLWREGYDTRRLGDLAFPTPEGMPIGAALIVVAGIGALPEFGIWTRLVESDFDAQAWRGLLVGDRAAFGESLPASRLARCLLVDGADLPVGPGRVLAGVVMPGELRCAMVGPPTEEAWDEFSDALRAARPIA